MVLAKRSVESRAKRKQKITDVQIIPTHPGLDAAHTSSRHLASFCRHFRLRGGSGASTERNRGGAQLRKCGCRVGRSRWNSPALGNALQNLRSRHTASNKAPPRPPSPFPARSFSTITRAPSPEIRECSVGGEPISGTVSPTRVLSKQAYQWLESAWPLVCCSNPFSPRRTSQRHRRED